MQILTKRSPLKKALVAVLPAIALVTGCGGDNGYTSVGVGFGVGVGGAGVGFGFGFQEFDFAPELVWFSTTASWVERLWINSDTGAVPFSDNFFAISGTLSGPVGTSLTVTEQLGPASLFCDRWSLVTEGTVFPKVLSCVRQPWEAESTNVTLRQAQRIVFQRNPTVGIQVFLDNTEYFVDFSATRRIQEQNSFRGNAESVPDPSL